MKSVIAFITAGVVVASHHTRRDGGSACVSGLCGVETVSIPQFNRISTVPRTYAKPMVFTHHGLIPVQAPPKVLVAPSYATTTTRFAVGAPAKGKVVDRTEPTYFCKKPGFVLEGVDCVQTLFENARLVCPAGFETYGNEGCVRRAAFLQTCPAGYVKRDGNCAKIITQAFVEVCPEGTVEGETLGRNSRVCQRQVPHPLSPTCPEGTYDARTGQCLHTVYAEARAYCPEGFNYDEGQGLCLQEEIYDCSDEPLGIQTIPQLGITQVAPVLHQRQHHTYHHKTHGHKRQLHHVTKAIVPVAPTVIQQVVQPAPVIATQVVEPCVAQAVQPCAIQPCVSQRIAPPCEQAKVMMQPTKTTISVETQKTCTRVTSTALVFDCEEGVLQGRRCLVRQQIASVPVCRGQGNADYCYSLQRVPALQECPAEFTKECSLGRACQCVALEATAFMTSCPSGFTANGSGCERTGVAQAVCPPGFVLQGDSCVRVLREAADCVFSVTYECERNAAGACV